MKFDKFIQVVEASEQRLEVNGRGDTDDELLEAECFDVNQVVATYQLVKIERSTTIFKKARNGSE